MIKIEKTIKVLVTDDIYSKQSIEDAKRAFSSYLKVKVNRLSKSKTELELTATNCAEGERRELFLEFLNYVLDRSTQIYSEKHT